MTQQNKVIKIIEVARFDCAQEENIRNITMSLAQAGRFVRIESSQTKPYTSKSVVVYSSK